MIPYGTQDTRKFLYYRSANIFPKFMDILYLVILYVRVIYIISEVHVYSESVFHNDVNRRTILSLLHTILRCLAVL